MTQIFAVDPGVRGCGVAVFDGPPYVLADAGYVARAENETLHDYARRVAQPGAWLIAELPQIYQDRAPDTDQNDLVDLAVCVGAVAAMPGWTEVTLIWPFDWKRCVPKRIMVERVKRRLRPEELARVRPAPKPKLMHNVWDAVGIGLWAARRRSG